eukprot:c8581_g1_i1.p1 GENE.c8581_g1_i1~~c8581_g1_i1.p1  ORF type:complete len:590 (+),score=100.65 c8581_g1_i1:35-1804(+)
MSDLSCVVCAEASHFFAVGSCGHSCCIKCSIRMREYFGDFKCVLCKEPSPTILFTHDPNQLPQSVNLTKCAFDRKAKGYFVNDQARDFADQIRACNCPVCQEKLPTIQALRKHVKDHGKQYCNLCVEHRKAFPSELTLFTGHLLDQHMRGLDKQNSQATGFKGHPRCDFCERRFYSDDELFDHLNKNHEQCHLCKRMGRTYEYYHDYRSLEEHFRAEHFLCEAPDCLAQRFIVFQTEIDYQQHTGSVHGFGQSSRGVMLDPRNLGFSMPSYRDETAEKRKGKGKGPKPFTPDFDSTAPPRRNNNSSSSNNNNTSSSNNNSSSTPNNRAPTPLTSPTSTSPSPPVPSPRPAPVLPVIPDEPQSQEELVSRNRKLVADMTACLKGDQQKFTEFRSISADFKNGKISSVEYYQHFTEMMGPEGVELFPELIALLPDRSKRENLIQAMNAAIIAAHAASLPPQPQSSSSANAQQPLPQQQQQQRTAPRAISPQPEPVLYAPELFPSLPGSSSSGSSSSQVWTSSQPRLAPEEFPALPAKSKAKKKVVNPIKKETAPAQPSVWQQPNLPHQSQSGKSGGGKKHVIVNNARTKYQ